MGRIAVGRLLQISRWQYQLNSCSTGAQCQMRLVQLAWLQENIAAFELDLDEDTLKAVDAIHLQHRNPNVID